METVSSWRATYEPGRWVVLAGPTSIVIMQPAPAHMSGLLGDLWQDVVSAADVSDLAQKFTAFRLDLMPHFAAFFWAGDGMHSLIRGSLHAVDVETGDVVADGEGFHTWNEVGLTNVRQVRVEMDDTRTEPVLALPLAVGVVLASTVTVDSSQKISLVLPSVPADEVPVRSIEPEVADLPAPVEVSAVAAADAAPEVPAYAPAPVVPLPVGDAIEDSPDAVAEPVSVPDELTADEPAADEPAPTVEATADEPVEALPEEPVDALSEAPMEAASDEGSSDHDAPEGADAEPSVPVEAQPEDLPDPLHAASEGEFDENSESPQEPYEPSWPARTDEPQADAWGVRSSEALAPVDLFVDENHDGVPDAEQAGLDLDDESANALTAPVPFDIPAPEAPRTEGFPGFPGADVAQSQGGFLPSGTPAPDAPQGPPPGWTPQQQNPYGPPASPYAPPQGQPPAAAFAAPGGPSGAPFGGSGPAFPPQQFPGQAYPGQPYPGQPFQSLSSPPAYSPQQPTYPPSPAYGGSMSPNGAPLTSPVPPPAAYAPAAPLPQGPGAPSEPGLPVSADSADSDSTVFSTGIAMTHKPSAPRAGGDNLVLAVVCAFGHPNPPGATRCRVCGQGVDNANPRLVHKPVLAQLITAGGARIEVTDTVLIGRAPSAQPGDGNPILLPVPSPNSDISRTHLKVAVRDWDIVATDLHSTNGTMLVRPGQAPVRMMAGTPVTVEPGTILDLGDGGVITVGLPA